MLLKAFGIVPAKKIMAQPAEKTQKLFSKAYKGEDIPEIARIISVADAYDAMTSHRSYRDILPQEVVRSEIEKGKGTQFDPVFADIMLQMIDEDKDYLMHED